MNKLKEENTAKQEEIKKQEEQKKDPNPFGKSNFGGTGSNQPQNEAPTSMRDAIAEAYAAKQSK